MQSLNDAYKEIWEGKCLACKSCGKKHTPTIDKGWASWICKFCGIINNLKIK